MDITKEFLITVLDSVSSNVVVTDHQGLIVYINETSEPPLCSDHCIEGACLAGINFFLAYQQHTNSHEQVADSLAQGLPALANFSGIKTVGITEPRVFELEYACCKQQQKSHWFLMSVRPLNFNKHCYYVFAYKDITERKLAEQKTAHLACVDSLTKCANRREFERFLASELKRCKRLKRPIALALIDVDHLKALNDSYGHQQGDACLVNVAKVLKRFAARPSDLSARYGGDEFALVWGDTDLARAASMAYDLTMNVAQLKLSNTASPVKPIVTLSIGVAAVDPSEDCCAEQLIARADQLLYQVKTQGRNGVCVMPVGAHFKIDALSRVRARSNVLT